MKYPQTLSELTIGDLERCWMPAPKEGEDVNSTKNAVEQLSNLMGLDFDEVWGTWNVEQMSELVTNMGWFFKEDFFAIPPQHTFDFKGRKYSFKDTFLHNSFGQFADAETVNRSVDNPFTRIRQGAAIFVLNEGQQAYDSDLVKNRMELFRDLPADIALGFGGFFLARGKQLREITLQHSLLKAAGELQRKAIENFPKSIPGISSFRRWQITTYCKLKLSRYKDLIKL